MTKDEALEETPRVSPEPEILGWATHHDEPMLFPTRKEAILYCEDDEEPRPLYTSPPKREPEPEDYPTYDGYIKKALEETPRVSPEPEPVAWGVDWGKAGDSTCVSIIKRLPGGGIEVVAVEYGPKREWQGLTDEQKVALCKQFPDHLTFNAIHAIEAKLKEKNT